MRIAGIVIAAVGLISLLTGGFSYKSTETVAQLGDLKMRATEDKKLNVPPVVSGIAIAVGTAMAFAGARKPNA
jgi:hypothetical protein